jgi:hypothetical protein
MGLVYNSILVVLVNKGFTKYSNRGTLILYLIIKYLGIEFKKLFLIKKVLITKVFYISTILTNY